MAKTKIVKRRHQITVKVANFLIAPFIKAKVGYHAKRIDVKKYEPFIVVGNHVTAFDPILLTGTFNSQVYYVASELIFSKGLISRLLEFFFAPIPKSKNQTDITSVKAMIQVVKEGGNVGVFVEGNSTMNGTLSNVPAAIGKLVLLLKIPLIIYNFHGGYLSNPRWATTKRKQKNFTGNINKVLTYDDYKHMSPSEINDLIISEINVDNYETPAKGGYFSKKGAEGIHRLLFTCPFCNAINSGTEKGNKYTCKNCGFTMVYDEFGYLHSPSFDKPKTTIELDHTNKIIYQDLLVKNPTTEISAKGKFSEVFRRRRKHFGQAEITLSIAGLKVAFKNPRIEDLFIALDDLEVMAMQQKEVLVIYAKHAQTRMINIPNTSPTSSYQFLITLQILKNIKAHENRELVPLTVKEMGL